MKFQLVLILAFFSLSGFAQTDTTDFGKCRIILHSHGLEKTENLQDFNRVLSPSGRFRFYYTETGTHALPASDVNLNGINDYIDTARVEIEEIFDIEVTSQGISSVFLDTVAIYFKNLGGGLYGQTLVPDSWTFSSYPLKGPSYIEINTRLNSLPTKGMDMIRVTLAHEFHHVLHFQSGVWLNETSNFLFYYEMSATFFEEVVYNEINDYQHYLKNGIYNQPTLKLFGNTGNSIYSMAIFFQFIRDRYGLSKAQKFASSALNYLSTRSPAIAMYQASLDVLGVPIDQVYHDFSLITTFTGNRSLGKSGLVEAGEFPDYRTSVTDTITSNSGTGVISRVQSTGFLIKWIKNGSDVFPVAISRGDFVTFNSEASQVITDTLTFFAGPDKAGSYELSEGTWLHVTRVSPFTGNWLRGSIYNPVTQEIESFQIADESAVAHKPDIRIGPNPIDQTKTAVFSFLNLNPDYQLSLRLISLTGKELKKGSYSLITDRLILNVNDWFGSAGSGIYFFLVENGNGDEQLIKVAFIRQ